MKLNAKKDISKDQKAFVYLAIKQSVDVSHVIMKTLIPRIISVLKEKDMLNAINAIKDMIKMKQAIVIHVGLIVKNVLKMKPL